MNPKQTKMVTTTIMLEKRMPRKDGLFPVKLRVTSDRKQKYYTIRYVPVKIGEDFTDHQKFWMRKADKSISVTEKEFTKIRKENPSDPFKTMSIYLNAQEADAIETIAKIKPFTFEAFEEKYFSKAKDDQDLLVAIEVKADTLKKEGRINTSVLYQNTFNSLKEFTKKSQLPFGNVTVKFLREYEKWMKERTFGKKTQKHVSKTTISIYLRCLRSVTILDYSRPVIPEQSRPLIPE